MTDPMILELVERYNQFEKNAIVDIIVMELCEQLDFPFLDIPHYGEFVSDLVTCYIFKKSPPYPYAFYAMKKIGKYRKLLKDQFGWSATQVKTISRGFIGVTEDQIMYVKLLQIPCIDLYAILRRFDELLTET